LNLLGCENKMQSNNSFADVEQILAPHLKILVADDDEQSQHMLEFILKRTGHEVKFAVNGQDAVQKVKSGDFDLVLMDVQMPLMDGVEATRQIRAWEDGNQSVFVVGLTAILDADYKTCLEAGMDSIIAKPFDTDEFFEVLLALAQKKKTPRRIVARDISVVLDVPGAVKRFADDRAHYAELLEEFTARLLETYAELLHGVEVEDWETLSHQVHNLKGLSANFGALALSQCALELEDAIHNSRQQVQEKLSAVETGIHDVRSEALLFLNSLPGDRSTP
jgi:two-component system, sensor histidine kinase and response regulator